MGVLGVGETDDKGESKYIKETILRGRRWWERPPRGGVTSVSPRVGGLASEELKGNAPGEGRAGVEARSGKSLWCSSVRKATGWLGAVGPRTGYRTNEMEREAVPRTVGVGRPSRKVGTIPGGTENC